jgi:hypothetical protein
MIMRLFEGEVRADSMTSPADAVSFSTQASNFSRLKRSAASLPRMVVSIPNCRKQSEMTLLTGSLSSINAARAEARRLKGRGTTAVLEPLSIPMSALMPILARHFTLGKRE